MKEIPHTNSTDHRSWTGCGKHVELVMSTSPKENWCTCEPIDADEQHEIGDEFPPRAGTGFARKSSVSS